MVKTLFNSLLICLMTIFPPFALHAFNSTSNKRKPLLLMYSRFVQSKTTFLSALSSNGYPITYQAAVALGVNPLTFCVALMISPSFVMINFIFF